MESNRNHLFSAILAQLFWSTSECDCCAYVQTSQAEGETPRVSEQRLQLIWVLFIILTQFFVGGCFSLHTHTIQYNTKLWLGCLHKISQCFDFYNIFNCAHMETAIKLVIKTTLDLF